MGPDLVSYPLLIWPTRQRHILTSRPEPSKKSHDCTRISHPTNDRTRNIRLRTTRRSGCISQAWWGSNSNYVPPQLCDYPVPQFPHCLNPYRNNLCPGGSVWRLIYNIEQDPVPHVVSSRLISYSCHLSFCFGNRLTSLGCHSRGAVAQLGASQGGHIQPQTCSDLNPDEADNVFLNVIKHRFFWTLRFFCILNQCARD